MLLALLIHCPQCIIAAIAPQLQGLAICAIVKVFFLRLVNFFLNRLLLKRATSAIHAIMKNGIGDYMQSENYLKPIVVEACY